MIIWGEWPGVQAELCQDIAVSLALVFVLVFIRRDLQGKSHFNRNKAFRVPERKS